MMTKDAFSQWQAENGERVTVQIDGDEVVLPEAEIHAPCPTHPEQWFHKTTKCCSCGEVHREWLRR